jgi:hypothetical protein
MFAVEEDWIDSNIIVMCRVCNNAIIKIFSLTPEDYDEYTKLEKRFGDKNSWEICENCIEKLQHEINCKIIITDAETVSNYEFEEYEKEDLKIEGEAIDKINKRSILCPVCNKEMNIDTGLPKFKEDMFLSRPYKIKISCTKCGFTYSEEKAFAICGTIIDCNKNFIMLEPTTPPPYIEDLVSKPVLDMIKRNQRVKGVVYQNDNLNLKALKSLKKLGSYLEFLIIKGKIVRILTGDE